MKSFNNSRRTKRITVNRILFFTSTFMGVSFAAAWAGPTIHSADPAFIACNTKLDDQIALVVLADIPASSVIFLSDVGWENGDFTFGGREGVFRSLADANGITGEVSIPWREGIKGM